ncbi:hypothetical protein IQ07DRAFT_593357 [Pyrenochaeta sp. DS3sAY3a]|nr:hypothetical protein IQ07DRAFT_593357 [Pyrenochaeta sp. DS3sAY3a]
MKRYPESQVHPQAVIETADSFASYLCGKLVLEVKTLEQAPSRDFCYNLQILNSLRHETRILQLVGVTTDDNRRRVKSYLVEWPITKCQRLLDRASSSDSPWGKIETWSRRLIRAIHAVHSRFFVVGTLRYPRPPIIVDAYDNIYLHRFKSEFRLSRSAAPFYPPEYRHYAQLYTGVPTDIDQPILTPAYDLYQLGQILWILAESWATGQSAMALKEWFYREPNTWRGGLYTGPDPLPLLSDKVPRYYQDVVNYCCAPDPSDRLPCKDLLRMFPPSNNDMEPEPSNLTAEPMSIQSMQDCRMDAVMCEFCRKLIDSRLYKCMICVNSDFDVCSQCFDTGMHCYDPDHLLVEATIGDEFPIKTRYHSSPNKLGVRTIVVDG